MTYSLAHKIADMVANTLDRLPEPTQERIVLGMERVEERSEAWRGRHYPWAVVVSNAAIYREGQFVPTWSGGNHYTAEFKKSLRQIVGYPVIHYIIEEGIGKTATFYIKDKKKAALFKLFWGTDETDG